MPAETSMSEDAEAARRIAFTLAKAENALGITHRAGLPLSYRMEMILSGAMENPAAVDDEVYSLAYVFSQQRQSNVEHEKLKQQPGGPLHEPKPEAQKQ